MRQFERYSASRVIRSKMSHILVPLSVRIHLPTERTEGHAIIYRRLKRSGRTRLDNLNRAT